MLHPSGSEMPSTLGARRALGTRKLVVSAPYAGLHLRGTSVTLEAIHNSPEFPQLLGLLFNQRFEPDHLEVQSIHVHMHRLNGHEQRVP